MKHSEETKKKLSLARKKYLSENNLSAWKKTEHHKSIPCEIVKNQLKELNISYIEEYQPLLHLKRYFAIDIAFPDKKIGVEINGRQHYNEKGDLLPYYQNRHDLISAAGWKLYEIPYHYAFNKQKMEHLFMSISSEKTINEFDYSLYIPKHKKKKSENRAPKWPYPPIEELKELAEILTLSEICRKLKIPMKAMWRHLKKNNIKPKINKFHEAISLLPSNEDLQKQANIFSLQEMSKIFGIRANTLSRILKQRGIVLPDKSKWAQRERPKSRKVTRPSKETLEMELKNSSFVRLGIKYGVSDNAIRKWCKSYGI